MLSWLSFQQPSPGCQNISHCQQQYCSGLHHPDDHIPPNWVFISIVLYAVYVHVIPDVYIHGVPWTSLTWPILCVLSPVFNVDICRARDNKFQLACIKEINQLRIQNLKTEKQDTLSLGSTSVHNSFDCALCLIWNLFPGFLQATFTMKQILDHKLWKWVYQ